MRAATSMRGCLCRLRPGLGGFNRLEFNSGDTFGRRARFVDFQADKNGWCLELSDSATFEINGQLWPKDLSVRGGGRGVSGPDYSSCIGVSVAILEETTPEVFRAETVTIAIEDGGQRREFDVTEMFQDLVPTLLTPVVQAGDSAIFEANPLPAEAHARIEYREELDVALDGDRVEVAVPQGLAPATYRLWLNTSQSLSGQCGEVPCGGKFGAEWRGDVVVQ